MTILGQSDPIPAEKSEKLKVRRRLDFAYACFVFLGLALMAITSIQFADKGNREGWGMLLGLSLPLPMLIAFVTAIVLTVKSRHHAPVVVLCLTTILYLGVTAALGLSDRCSEDACGQALDAAAWTYAAVATLVPAWWFTIGRWRNRDMPLTHP